MPKIFGKVALVGNRVRCSVCNSEWEPNAEEIDDITNGRKVTCIVCRAMNEIRPGQIIPKNSNYKLMTSVKYSNPDELRGENYYDKKATVLHGRCRRGFEAKLIDIRQGNLECPHCKNAKRVPIEDKESVEKSKGLLEIVDKSEVPRPSKLKDLEKPGKASDKIVNNSVRIMRVDKKTNTCIVQCIKCGLEETKDLNIITNGTSKEQRAHLVCSRCSNERVGLDEIRRNYLGKIFNGLRIEEIYENEDGIVLCNLTCIQHKKEMSLDAYILSMSKKESLTGYSQIELDRLHVQINVPIGDVINKRIYCKVCGDKEISSIAKFKPYMTCPNMDGLKKDGVNVQLCIKGIKAKEFYDNVINGTLCDYCSGRKVCKFAGREPRNSMSTISALMDMQDNLLTDILNIQADYPGMFDFKSTDIKGIDIKPITNLLVVKEAYIGRNGATYRTCKCTQHGKEMVLSDAEIASFNHEQCIENNAYMGFFNISKSVYLGRSEK